ncbi:MAG: DUF1616 domain-containing protein [Candidatus Bathyarchaeota archaeon]|nr:MAG: DUF1616 domain-containing protein [Candidatus Bathyarchaeota archaeon]
MTAKEHQKASIEECILQTIKEKKPENISQLAEMVQQQFALPKQKIVEHIIRLESEGKIKLKDTSHPKAPKEFHHFLRTRHAYWYWTITILAAATTILVFTIPENAIPFVYARYILGSIFVLWLPGYSLIKTLFPRKEIDNLERAVLSIGMSLALIPITGLLLNYTPWGIRLTPITLSLLALTLALATAALVREYQIKTSSP